MYPPFVNPPYPTMEVGPIPPGQAIDLAALHLLATPADATDLAMRFVAAQKEAGAKPSTFSTFEQGVGRFDYYLLPGDPRKPLALQDQNGVEVAGFVGEWVWQINERGIGYPGHVVYAPIPDSPDTKPVFTWVWDE
jgi:hypothetical protein